MRGRPLILKGVIHGRTIVLDHDPGLEDGREVAVRLAESSQTVGEVASESEPWERWPEELEKIKRIQPGDGLRQAAGAWAEYADEIDEFLEASRLRRNVSREPLDP